MTLCKTPDDAETTKMWCVLSLVISLKTSPSVFSGVTWHDTKESVSLVWAIAEAECGQWELLTTKAVMTRPRVNKLLLISPASRDRAVAPFFGKEKCQSRMGKQCAA
jgi:hypothetical protein